MAGRRHARTLGTWIALNLLVTPTWAAPISLVPAIQADISRLADTAHVEFRGQKNWRYEVQKAGPKRITLSVPKLDAQTIAKLEAFTDPLLAAVKVDPQGIDGNALITFTLTQDDVESFDYLTDEPSRLIIDFYRKAEPVKPTVAKVEAPVKTDAVKKTVAKIAKASTNASRKPAGDEFIEVPGGPNDPRSVKDANGDLHFGVFDGGDDNYDRFRIKDYEIREEAIIASRHNIYLPFPMLKMKVSLLDKFIAERPEFAIHPRETGDVRQNKEARLLLALFERKRFAVFQKTYDYFMKKYPESEYGEILKNLMAYVHLARWREAGTPAEFDASRAIFNELVQKYPASPLREHNYLLLGFMQFDRGDALATLQTMQGFESAYPNAPEIPVVRNALAECYMLLRRYDEATDEYNRTIKEMPNTASAREARYRLGDVAFAKGDFTSAIKLYEGAIREFPAFEKTYPNADFNMAEARFWQKDFKNALGNYVQFVNYFPTDTYGGYALTRIGELLGILGADQRRVMGAFLESYFRFPNHPGAQVARIRMLSQQMRGMKPKEEKKALEEIAHYSEKLDLPGMNEFTTLMVSEGLSNRGEYKDALAGLIGYYQKNPTSANLDSFRSRILRNIASQLEDHVNKGDFIQALKFYSQYAKTWLKNSGRIDVPYLLAGAYERAGANSEAKEIYADTLARRQKIVGTDEEKEKKAQEHLPSVASLHLRLASVLAQERGYMDAFQHLKAIDKGADLTPPEQIERVRLSALIAEQRNDPKRAREALVELATKWKGDPALLAPVNLQLAQTYMKLGDLKQAESYADRVLKAEGGETPVPDKTLADAMSVKGDSLGAQKKTLAAIETYQKLLERFETKLPLAPVRYRVGQILFDRGDLKGASDVWERLRGGPNEFLYKVGHEKLEDMKFHDEYNKYISRIPAMEGK